MVKKPTIAVSACLLGDRVRYDGCVKTNEYIIYQLSELFLFKAICPEVAIGLSVPRPPMQLTRLDGQVQAVRIDQPSINYTQNLIRYAEQILPELSDISAYIFKARSPSCGVESTPLGDELVSGIFAQTIKNSLPDLPLIDESQLQTDQQRKLFIEAVKNYAKKM